MTTKLILSRPFRPSAISNSIDARYFFADPAAFDLSGFALTANSYEQVFYEEAFATLLGEAPSALLMRAKPVADFVTPVQGATAPKIAFLASNDTHVHFMLSIAAELEDCLFIVPNRVNKDEGAIDVLESVGADYVEIGYRDNELPALDEKNIGLVFTGADWTSEFIAVKRCIGERSIATVALQEGPQDWHMRFVHNGVLKIPNHYRNCDVAFSQGAVTLQSIRPRYMAITGNTKINKVTEENSAAPPRAIINCNFTYLETKPAYEDNRALWLEQAIGACRKAGLDYIISQHPRDDGVIDDPNLLPSNAGVVTEQIKQCTVMISRFSSLTYEALAQGLESIYFNPHLEPMPTFNEDRNDIVPAIGSMHGLTKFLKEHVAGERTSVDQKRRYLERHAGPQDGLAHKRIIENLRLIAANEVTAAPEISADTSSLSKVAQKPKGVVAIFSRLPAQGYSGGRYHAVMKAEAFAGAGYKVFLVTDNYPPFYSDFRPLEHHQSIEVLLTRDFKPVFPPEYTIDFVICVPGGQPANLYEGSLQAAHAHGAKLAMLNFESPNWFNEMSPEPRDEAFWDQWVWLSKYCDAIVSSAEESVRYARDYYREAPEDCQFLSCSPAINSVVADIIPDQPAERRIFAPTRFQRATHKGGNRLAELITEDWRGFTFVLLVGADGQVPDDIMTDLRAKADQCGVQLELLAGLNDLEKFHEYKRACLTLFPSFFEGYGLPPVESLYCNTPCACFDLPVLRETCGDALIATPPGDWDAYRDAVADYLRAFKSGDGVQDNLRQAVEAHAAMDSFVERADEFFIAVCNRVLEEQSEAESRRTAAFAEEKKPPAQPVRRGIVIGEDVRAVVRAVVPRPVRVVGWKAYHAMKPIIRRIF